MLMKKLFTLAAAVLASMAMSAEVIFSFTVTSATTAKGSYDVEGGTAVCSGAAMQTGGSNEITIGDQTFYKFSSSSTWDFTLADNGTFAEGDVISITAACGTSAKKGKGVTLNGIAVTGDFPASTANTLTYTVQAGDAIAGKTTIQVKRNDSDIKFGTIVVERENVTPSTDPVEAAEISGENGCLVGNSIELTCTAAKATTYQWSMNGTEIEGANAKKYTFSPTAAGEYSFTCAASNEYTTTPVVAAAHVVTVMDPANAYGELIKATLLGGTSATMTGVIGGTFDTNLGSGKFKLDKGKYFGITLAAGNFREGDTVVITMTTAGSNYPCLFADKERTNCLFLATETSSDLEYRIVLPAAANSINTLYVSRGDESDGYKWNPVLSSMAVVRPMAAKNVIESLTGVAVDDVAISDLAALLANHEITLADSYVNAPVVKFTKHVVTTYIDDSQAEKDVVVEVTAEEVEGAWEATATIGGVAYTVKAAKENSVVVTYMDGENKLGEENVAIGGHPADFAQYQNKSLASFVGWYNNADLADEHIVADMSSEVISVATTYYAKFENAYAQSINIEKAVMQNGKGYAIIPQLGTLKYASNITGSLDSLAVKDDGLRNYAYLGLKVKQAGALLNFRLAKGSTVKVKFGNVAKTPLVSINGGEYAEMTITDKVYSYTAEEEAIVSIKTADGNAVVFQQIMINEDLQAPELFTITCAAAEHGTVSAPYKMGIPGEVIKLSFTMDEGYTVTSCYANEVEVVGTAEGEFFTMPAANVTITATFGDETTAIDNTNAELKAVKVIENGQIFIIKNGVKYNAQGAIVK